MEQQKEQLGGSLKLSKVRKKWHLAKQQMRDEFGWDAAEINNNKTRRNENKARGNKRQNKEQN